MSQAILKWLGGRGVGESSKAIALTALGQMPDHPGYPSDGDDFGRCHRLLEQCPAARVGLTYLGQHGGPAWAALVARWPEITAHYLSDMRQPVGGKRHDCYALMKAILDPIEDADPNIIRFGGATLHTRPRHK